MSVSDTAPPGWMARALVVAIVLGSILTGCGAPPPEITGGPDPADPRAAARAAAYVPVTAGTVEHRPVEPKSWRDMNERVTPRGGRAP